MKHLKLNKKDHFLLMLNEVRHSMYNFFRESVQDENKPAGIELTEKQTPEMETSNDDKELIINSKYLKQVSTFSVTILIDYGWCSFCKLF